MTERFANPLAFSGTRKTKRYTPRQHHKRGQDRVNLASSSLLGKWKR